MGTNLHFAYQGQLAVLSRTPALLSQSQAKDKSFGLPFLASPVYQNDLLTLVVQNNCRTEYSAITFSQAFRDERKACLIEIHLEDIDKNKRKGFWLKKHCWLMSGNKWKCNVLKEEVKKQSYHLMLRG